MLRYWPRYLFAFISLCILWRHPSTSHGCPIGNNLGLDGPGRTSKSNNELHGGTRHLVDPTSSIDHVTCTLNLFISIIQVVPVGPLCLFRKRSGACVGSGVSRLSRRAGHDRTAYFVVRSRVHTHYSWPSSLGRVKKESGRRDSFRRDTSPVGALFPIYRLQVSKWRQFSSCRTDRTTL